MPETCPVCDSPHDTYTGVAMHMCKKADDDHPWSTQNDALEYLSEQGYIGVGSSGEGTVVDTSEPDTSTDTDTAADGGNPLVGDADPDEHTSDDTAGDSGAGCCDDPELEPAEGVYALESGDHVRADGDDEFCQSCGALVEADGTVMY